VSTPTALGEQRWWGLIILFAAIGYAGLAGEEQRATDLHTRAKPLSANDPSAPVAVTGELVSSDIAGAELKPARYRGVLQSSEVFAWEEYETTVGNNLDTRTVCALRWTSAPRDPASFKTPECRKEPLFKKSRDLEHQWPSDAVVKTGDRTLAIDLSQVTWPVLDEPVAPKPADLIRGDAAITATEGNDLLIYASKPCNVEQPAPGCERTRVSVLRPLEGEITFIGKLDGDRLGKFEDTLKGAAGDQDSLLEAFSVETRVDGFRIWLTRSACFAGIWVGLALLLGPTRRLLRAVPKLAQAPTPTVVISVGLALGIAAVLLRTFALVLGTAVVIALFVASRAKAPEPPR
jgi:hypothetical protein